MHSNLLKTPQHVTHDIHARQAGRFRALARALKQDLEQMLKECPSQISESVLARCCQRDLKRAKELLG